LGFWQMTMSCLFWALGCCDLSCSSHECTTQFKILRPSNWMKTRILEPLAHF
jgi:hypothetical protein